MALRDLLVHVDRSQAGMIRMRLAADLAARHGARLVVLHVRAHTINQAYRLKISELGLVPAAGVGADESSIKSEHEMDSEMLYGLLQQLQRSRRLDAEWCEVGGNIAKTVIERSRYADLTIVGHDASRNDDLPDGYSFAESVLFLSGRPLIIIPPGVTQTTLGANVALAWNGSRAAARALNDALPLIEKAEGTFVLTAELLPSSNTDGFCTVDIFANIGRHAANAKTVTLKGLEGVVGDQLQNEALALCADLLVTGAYGQPRVWERMLGGTTRDLLSRMRIPMLMSH